MSLGWVKGQRPLPHRPQRIRNGVTLVKMILERSTSSRFANVPPYPSVFRDKGLAEMAKKVCVVNAVDYSYLRSVRGDNVTQTLVGYKNPQNVAPKRCRRREGIPQGSLVQHPEEDKINLASNHRRHSPHVSAWNP